MAGPGGDGPPARGLATIQMAEHHGKVMMLYALGKRYAEIARMTGYSFNGVRRIVISELAKRTMAGPVAEMARGRADAAWRSLSIGLNNICSPMMIRCLRWKCSPIHQAHQSAGDITIPKLATKVDVLVVLRVPSARSDLVQNCRTS